MKNLHLNCTTLLTRAVSMDRPCAKSNPLVVIKRRFVTGLGAALLLASVAGRSAAVAQEVGTLSTFAGAKPTLDVPILGVVASTTSANRASGMRRQ